MCIKLPTVSENLLCSCALFGWDSVLEVQVASKPRKEVHYRMDVSKVVWRRRTVPWWPYGLKCTGHTWVVSERCYAMFGHIAMALLSNLFGYPHHDRIWKHCVHMARMHKTSTQTLIQSSCVCVHSCLFIPALFPYFSQVHLYLNNLYLAQIFSPIVCCFLWGGRGQLKDRK